MRGLWAVLVVGALLTGCSALGIRPPSEPVPSARVDWDAPVATSSPMPAPTTPSPVAASPAPNGLTWGPKPGTVLGPAGHALELIPSDPNERFRCEPLPRSSDAGKTLSRRDFVDWARPAVRVAVSEGFAIAFWDTVSFDGVERHTNYAVWARDFTGIITEDWQGTHTDAGIAFEDGPKALRAAIECLARKPR